MRARIEFAPGHENEAITDQDVAAKLRLMKLAPRLLEALKDVVRCDEEARAAVGKPAANLNGLGLVDLFDLVGHPFGVGPHRQQPSRSNDLDVTLQDARALIAEAEGRSLQEQA